MTVRGCGHHEQGLHVQDPQDGAAKDSIPSLEEGTIDYVSKEVRVMVEEVGEYEAGLDEAAQCQDTDILNMGGNGGAVPGGWTEINSRISAWELWNEGRRGEGNLKMDKPLDMTGGRRRSRDFSELRDMFQEKQKGETDLTGRLELDDSDQGEGTHWGYSKYKNFSSIWDLNFGGKEQQRRNFKIKLKQTKLVFGRDDFQLDESSANRKRGWQEDKGSADRKRLKADLNLDDLGNPAI